MVISNRLLKIYPLLRILVGGLFVVSGLEKLLTPVQNFVYVLQGYQIVPPLAEQVLAFFFPWVEFLTGVFLVAGLGVRVALRVAAFLFTGFIVFLGQAIWRGLPLQDCGCFGDLVHVPPKVTILTDLCWLTMTAFLARRPREASAWGLDALWIGKS